MSRKLQFFIEAFSETVEDADEIYIKAEGKLETAAEEYAYHYHYNKDGWEATWPVIFTVAENNKILGKVSVERESVPVFTGERLG